jgi:hypothetical protein
MSKCQLGDRHSRRVVISLYCVHRGEIEKTNHSIELSPKFGVK